MFPGSTEVQSVSGFSSDLVGINIQWRKRRGFNTIKSIIRIDYRGSDIPFQSSVCLACLVFLALGKLYTDSSFIFDFLSLHTVKY